MIFHNFSAFEILKCQLLCMIVCFQHILIAIWPLNFIFQFQKTAGHLQKMSDSKYKLPENIVINLMKLSSKESWVKYHFLLKINEHFFVFCYFISKIVFFIIQESGNDLESIKFIFNESHKIQRVRLAYHENMFCCRAETPINWDESVLFFCSRNFLFWIFFIF